MGLIIVEVNIGFTMHERKPFKRGSRGAARAAKSLRWRA